MRYEKKERIGQKRKKEEKIMMLFIAGMMFGSFSGVLVLLFLQGAYKNDHAWQVECDRQYLENQERSALRLQSKSKGNK